MKRLLSFLMALLFGIGVCFIPVQATNTNVYYKTRDDFYWGINHHHEGFECYPEAYLEQRINLIARAGCNIIRINGYISKDMTYLDQVVGLCNKYGLKIIMTYIPELDMGLEYIELSCKSLAERYNGKDGRGFVDYIQVLNETDAVLIKDKNGPSAPAGKVFSDYFTIPVDGYADLPEYTKYFKAAAKGIHQADSKTKFMINFCYKHWGTILWYLNKGVIIDAIGWDSYGQSVDTKTSIDAFKKDCEELHADVVQKYNVPVIITETNTTRELIPDDNATHEIGNYEILLNMMEVAYQYNWIKGLIVYELLDEPNLANGEAHWGMVDCKLGGVIGKVKPIYSKIQQLLGGNNKIPVFDRKVVNLKPYEKIKVDTIDDSQISKESIVPSVPISAFPNITIPDIQIDNIEVSDDVPEKMTIGPETIVKKMNVTRTAYEFPWLLTILASVGILLASGGSIVLFLILKKRESAKNSLKESQ